MTNSQHNSQHLAPQNNSTEIEIRTVRALQDNYCYLIHRRGSKVAAVVDTSDATPIEEALKKFELSLGLILNTHHHHDHVGGNTELAERWNVDVYCSTPDIGRIPNAKRALSDGEKFSFDGVDIEVISIPGHTRGQIAFYIPAAQAVFVGDTVFAMGCGRLLEGTAEQMYQSLTRLAELPPKTRIFFGHEYTEKNGTFAGNVEPGNTGIQDRLRTAREALSSGRIPLAATLAEEQKVNPFLRLKSPVIRRQLGLETASDLEVLTSLRRLRDVFQG